MELILAEKLLFLTGQPQYESLNEWARWRLGQVHSEMETAQPERVRFHQGEASLLREMLRLRESAIALGDR